MTPEEQKSFYELIGKLISQARLSANLKQEEFASKLKLSRASIVNIEKGRQHPGIHQLWTIAKVLNIDIITLLPKFTSSPEISENWTSIVSKESEGNKETEEKLLDFLNQVKQSSTGK